MNNQYFFIEKEMNYDLNSICINEEFLNKLKKLERIKEKKNNYIKNNFINRKKNRNNYNKFRNNYSIKDMRK